MPKALRAFPKLTNRVVPVTRLTLVMVPTALVLPSLKTSLCSVCRYSGVLMKRKCTVALSPVRRQSLFMVKMVAVCLMLPQCTGETDDVMVKELGL